MLKKDVIIIFLVHIKPVMHYQKLRMQFEVTTLHGEFLPLCSQPS